MNKNQFFRRNSHLNVDESEISRKWRVYQEEQEFLMMVEAERQGRGQATIPSPGGGSGSLDQEVIYSLSLSFDDISSANILVGDSTNVVDWNLFFDLPIYGNPFTSVVIVGNGVQLFGGSDITIKENTFISNNSIIKVIDLGCVTSIYTDSFSYCENITEISFPECLDITGGGYFDAGAFYGLVSLTSIYFPKLIAIDNQCFGNCISLTTIDLPNLTTAGEDSFSDCASLTTINLPLLTTTAGETCFYNCTSLTTIDLPLLTTAGGNCFYNCTSLTTIDLPLLTTAGDGCFRNCTSLTTVDLPSLTTAGNNCFRDCTLPTTVNLPLLTTADGSCFAYCTSLTTVDLPLLTTAGETCFYSCTSLTTIDLPLLTTTGDSCFQDCTALTTISLPLLTMTGNYCFANCASLTTISLPECTNLGSTVGDNAVFANITGQTITLTVPLSLMTCNGGNPDGDIQFLQANNTVTIVISDSALRLTFDSIANADLLVGDSADVTDWNTFFDLPTYGNPFTVVDIAGNEVRLYGGSDITIKDSLFRFNTHLITIDDSIGCIIGTDDRCIDSCSSLTSINLPELVSANYYSFGACISLTTINLPKLITTGTYVFADLYNLQSVNLPLLEISGTGLFEYSSALTTINMPSCTNLGATVGDDGVFFDIIGNTITLTVPSALMTCNGGLPDGDIQYLQANNTVTIIEISTSLNLTFDNITNVPVADASSVTDWNTFFDLPAFGNPFTNVSINGNTVGLIGGSNIHLRDNLFSPGYVGNTSIISVIDTEFIISAGEWCFYDCAYLNEISLPLLTSAGDYCFCYCYSLATILLPQLTSAGVSCFIGASSTIISLPQLISAGNQCFGGCTSTIISLPQLTSAGNQCFQYCQSLTTISLPLLTSAGNQCFEQCTLLTTISLPSCIDLGDTIGNNNVFLNIIGKTITLTVPAALMTCNGGNPDGDIQYLQANNTVTIIEITPFISAWRTTSIDESITLPYNSSGTYVGTIDWGDGNISSNSYANRTHTYSIPGDYTIVVNGTINGWSFFPFTDSAASAVNIKSISQWGNLFRLGNQEQNFRDCVNLNLSEITDILNLTDTTSLSGMFYGCTSITTVGRMDEWDVSQVTNMSFMFQSTSAFNQNISSWDVGNVTTMEQMFIHATFFNQPIGAWNVGNVTTMRQMFINATNFNQNIGSWDVSNVTDMYAMLQNTTSFNQNLSNWCVSLIPTTPTNFDAGATSWVLPRPIWGTCPQSSLNLTFDDITNANTLVGDASSVTDWNTFFDLPTYGNPFTSVEVSGNTVSLFGGSNITIKNNLFNPTFPNTFLISIIDDINCIIYIQSNAFGWNTELTTVSLPNVITVEDYVFDITPNVTSIYMPELVTAGDQAFGSDIQYPYFGSNPVLTSLSLPKLETAGAYCFCGYNNVTTFNLPLLTSAGRACFENCQSLTTIDLPQLTTTGDYCFYYCTLLTSFNFPVLTTIGVSCFSNCILLTSISLPSCTNLGPTVGDDSVFNDIIGQTISLTVPSALMTCNGGLPDGDIQYLQANNTVTIITT